MAFFGIPAPVLTDSYKLSHPFIYPDAAKMVAYGEFRRPFDKDPDDHRLVSYGLRHIVEHYIARQWTQQQVDEAALFFSTHNAGNTPFPFPVELFSRIVREHDGWFPVKLEALVEGSVVFPHVPIFQITAQGEFSQLVTFMETLLTMAWYPSTVATLSRRARDVIETAYARTVDEDGYWSLESRLHDFGFRGCTSVEQSIIGGAAHLLNFTGTDTLSAAYHVQFRLNNGKPVGTSIPATEHSVMTAFPDERLAIQTMIRKFGDGVFACVMDSYDYAHALDVILPSIAAEKVGKGGYMVLRPDSGDPVETVLMALRAADKVFGSDVNKKGFKVLRGAGVIQGDGINVATLKQIAEAAEQAGYSAQNVAYGMGAGLLQRVHRDMMSFATKLCHITYADGTQRDVMKTPTQDSHKISLPGELAVFKDDKGFPVVHPKKEGDEGHADNLLKVVYDHGPAFAWDDFTTVRTRVQQQWNHYASNKTPDVLSDALKAKVRQVTQHIHELARTDAQ